MVELNISYCNGEYEVSYNNSAYYLYTQDFGKRLGLLLGSSKATLLLRQVVARLVEKNTRRVVRQVLSPKNVEGSFPLISAVLDLLPKL